MTDLETQASAGAPERWFLYLIECSNGAFYAGISNDVERRYAAHMSGKGAKFTRANPPVRLLGSRGFDDKSKAAQAEWQIRQLRRPDKLIFIAEDRPCDVPSAAASPPLTRPGPPCRSKRRP